MADVLPFALFERWGPLHSISWGFMVVTEENLEAANRMVAIGDFGEQRLMMSADFTKDVIRPIDGTKLIASARAQ